MNRQWTTRRIIWRAVIVVWVIVAHSTHGAVSSLMWLALGVYIAVSSVVLARKADLSSLRRNIYRACTLVGVAVIATAGYQTVQVFDGASAYNQCVNELVQEGETGSDFPLATACLQLSPAQAQKANNQAGYELGQQAAQQIEDGNG